MGGQSVQVHNKPKIKLLKKKRTEVRNQKKVKVLQKGKANVLRPSRPSKKKLQKDAKRRRAYVEAEKEKLLKSGLITQEDIDKMEAEKQECGEDYEEGMEVEN